MTGQGFIAPIKCSTDHTINEYIAWLSEAIGVPVDCITADISETGIVHFYVKPPVEIQCVYFEIEEEP